MRKSIATIGILFLAIVTYGQEWLDGTNKLYTNPGTTKVGIGTDSPDYLLDIDGDTLKIVGSSIPVMTRNICNGSYFSADIQNRLGTAGNWSVQGQGYATYGYLTLRKSSSTGMESKSGGGYFTASLDGYTSTGTNKIYVGGTVNLLRGTITSYPENSAFAGVIGIDHINSNKTFAGYFEGKVGVTSTLYAEKVEVKLEGDWPDYVFTKEHTLRPLQEVNTYIQQNGHLPEIPTAKEVEENGIDLGAMNAKLLQKIEELTLYTIEQQKSIDKLLEKVEKQDKVIEGLVTKTR